MDQDLITIIALFGEVIIYYSMPFDSSDIRAPPSSLEIIYFRDVIVRGDMIHICSTLE